MFTRIFKSGNSWAVRIPKELAFAEAGLDVEIERIGNALVLRPVDQDDLSDLGEVLAQFSDGFMAQGRLPEPEIERVWAPAPRFDGVAAEAAVPPAEPHRPAASPRSYVARRGSKAKQP